MLRPPLVLTEKLVELSHTHKKHQESTTSLMELIPEFFVLPAQWPLGGATMPNDALKLMKFDYLSFHNHGSVKMRSWKMCLKFSLQMGVFFHLSMIMGKEG